MTQNRYNHTAATFVAPQERPQQAQRADIIMPGPTSGASIDTVFTPVESRQGRDSTSARDRAKARLIDSIPMYAAIVIISLAGTVAYILTGQAGLLDSLFLFLTANGLSLLIFDFKRVRAWLDHSHAGVERHRIDAAVQIHRQQVEAEAQVRREALALQLRMLEDRDHERK